MKPTGCKVCRVLDRWDLTELEDELLARWRGEDGDRMGYRKLAEWLNVTLLRREMDRAGLTTFGGAAASRYERLTEGGSTGDQLEQSLRNSGLPIEDIRRDFVSYGVVRTHLKDCLGAERETTESRDAAWAPDALAHTRRYAESKAEKSVQAAVNAGRLQVGATPEISVSIELTCPACRATVSAVEALEEQWACDCEETE